MSLTIYVAQYICRSLSMSLTVYVAHHLCRSLYMSLTIYVPLYISCVRAPILGAVMVGGGEGESGGGGDGGVAAGEIFGAGSWTPLQ
jgi:hypothetical protein